MKSLFVKKSFVFFVFVIFLAGQFSCFAAGKNVKEIVPKEVTPVEYRNVYLNWNYEGTPQFFSYEDISKDLMELNYLISTAYAGYEEAVERGLNLETFAEQVEDYYYAYEHVYVDDYIKTLVSFLKDKITDTHFSFTGYNERCLFSVQNRVYFSDVYCTKPDSVSVSEGQKLSVVASYTEEINEGDLIEIGEENLFPFILNGQCVYRLGIVNTGLDKYLKLKANGKITYVPIKNYPAISHHDTVRIGEHKTDNSAYVSMSHFEYGNYYKTMNSAELALNMFINFGVKNKDKKNIIIDVRSNRGGYSDIVENFYLGLYSGIDIKKLNKMSDKQKENFYVNHFEKLFYPAFSDAFFVESPATLQLKRTVIEEIAFSKKNPEYEESLIQMIRGYLEEHRINPQKRKYNFVDYFLYRHGYLSKTKDIKISDHSMYNGKIIIIADRNSASAAEMIILQARLFFGEDAQVYVIGENTMGAISYGCCYGSYLPKSKVYVVLPFADYTRILEKQPSWHGEGYGFYPDYWCTSENLLETLVVLTGDDELKFALHGIDYDLR